MTIRRRWIHNISLSNSPWCMLWLIIHGHEGGGGGERETQSERERESDACVLTSL